MLWSQIPPAAGHASPMSYLIQDGHQMVVIAAGGLAPFGSKTGDYIVAFSLPAK